MNNSESLVELTPGEISILRKHLIDSLFSTFIFVFIALIACGVLYLFFGNIICTTILIIVALVLLLSSLAISVSKIKSVFADTGGRQKKIIVGTVSKLREKVTETKRGRSATRLLTGRRMTTSTSIDSEYFITIESGVEYPVQMELYYAVKEGDPVEISVAPHTGYTFNVRKLS